MPERTAVDRTELERLVGRGSEDRLLDGVSRSGSFDEYLRAVVRRPEVAQGVHRRLARAVSAPVESGGPLPASLAGLPAGLEQLASVAEPQVRILLVGAADRPSWESDAAWICRRHEAHSRTPEGAFFTFRWVAVDASGRPAGDPSQAAEDPAAGLPCPCREEPLRLVPADSRARVLEAMAAGREGAPRIVVDGPLCPSCRRIADVLLARARGDWLGMISHVRIERVLPSPEDGESVRLATLADPSSWALAGNRGLVALDPEEPAPSWDRVEAALDPFRGTAEAATPLDLVVLWPVLPGADPGEPPEKLRTRVAVVRIPE